jgi:hypothetical protein
MYLIHTLLPCFDYDWYFLYAKFQNSKLFCHFLVHGTFISGYLQGHYKRLYHRSRRWRALVAKLNGGGSGNLSTSLSNVAKLAAHPKFVWVFNANCDGTIIYNDLYVGTTGL